MNKQLDIKFRFRPLLSSPDGILLDYLKKQEPSRISHEMLLKALRAFWLPDAYRECGKKKKPELKKLAQNMILVLEEQANYLRTVFDIERQTMYQISGETRQDLTSIPSASVISDEEEKDIWNVWNSVEQIDTSGV